MSDTALFDPLVEGFVDSPYEQYARLRELDPVHRSDLMHGWIITRFDDVGRLLRDQSISSSVHNATPTPLTIMEIERLSEQPRAAATLVLADEPDHTRIRKLMADPFRPREVEKLRAMITQYVDDAIDALCEKYGDGPAEIDLVADFAYPLPVQIFSQMLGVPEEDHPRFRYWTQCVARSIDPIMGEDERDTALQGLDDMYAYLEQQAEEKKAHPGDDLMTHLVNAEIDGEQLTHEELMAQLVTLYMAGHEPTAAVIAAGMLALLRAPDQMQMLRDNPDLLRNAISEFLRYDGPNQFMRRITTQPTVVADLELPAGAVLYVSPAAANRDHDRWGDTAEELHIDRTDAGQHLQFGAGAHACLGSHLARLQAEIAFAALFEHLHDIELAGRPDWGSRMFIRALNALPVRCKITP